MFESITSLFSSTPQDATGQSTEDTGDLKKAFSEAKDATEKLKGSQDQVDQMLSYLANKPEHRELYLKLDAAKSESRGFFSEYVAPAWDTIVKAVESIEQSVGLGFLPLIAGAAILGSAAIVALCYSYVSSANTAWEREQAILNDPSIPADLKREMLGQGGLTSIFGSAKNLILVSSVSIGGLLILKTVLDAKKKRRFA